MFSYVIFDLDGTLLNTLEDLADAGNWVCQKRGWPTHTLDEYRYFVGNGMQKLVERFSPEQARSSDEITKTMEEFMSYYNLHKEDKTAPYPGMVEAARRLGDAGVSIAVLSNKADQMAGPVVEGYYPGIFSIVQGALPDVPTKPDPTLLRRLMGRMGADPAKTLFVGDSNVDIQTAQNGGLTSCGVLWGFRTREELLEAGADHLAETAEDLVRLILA